MENYEQKYKEALERARLLKLANPDDEAIQTFVKDSFPELRESEDERIRKVLITLIKVPRNAIFEAQGITKEQALAWLEKQKEQKPVEWSEEDEAHLKWLCRIIRNVRLHGKLSLKEESELAKWIDKWINHEPQQEKKWSEFDQDCLNRAVWYVENPAPSVLKDTNLALWLKSLPERFNFQPKQEWSEEDKFKLEDAITGIDVGIGFYETEGKHPNLLKAIIEAKEWLKSLRPQSKSEWSEEDEEMFDEALAGVLLARNRMNDTGCIGLAERFEKAYKWLESFRPRPHWKPSEEQKPEAKLTGWVARDRNGEIYVYGDYPEKDSERPIWIGSNSINLYQESFPDLKWENEPVEVEITIRKK